MAKETYRQRIERGLAKGLTLSQARGHPKKGEQTARERLKEVKNRQERVAKGREIPKPPREKLPTKYHIDGWQGQGKGKPKRHRVFDVPLSPEQAKEVVRLEKLGKPITAKTYVLAMVYGSGSTEKFPAGGGTPILAGIDRYQNGMDYDTGQMFPTRERAGTTEYYGVDYSEYDYDWYDYPEEDDGDYGIH